MHTIGALDKLPQDFECENFIRKPWLGYVYQIMMVICLCLQQFFGKMLYIRNPSLSAPQLLFIRSIVSFLFFTGLMERKFIHYMFTGIPSD